MLYSNVDGLSSILREMRDIIRDSKPHEVFPTGTKLSSGITNDTLSFENCNLLREDRVTKQGEGLIIIARDKSQVNQIDTDTPDEVEIIAFEIKTEDVIIRKIYIPPAARTGIKMKQENDRGHNSSN